MSRQYLRRAQLIAGTGEHALDLSALRLKFSTRQCDLQTPNTATIRVYNLADATAQQIQTEFTRVVLQVGYEGGDFGVLFDGTIVQVRRGRESAIDNYVDIIAADGDEALNFAIVSLAMDKGSTFRDRVEALARAMKVPVGHLAELPASQLPRGKTYYGMARDHLRDIAASTDTKWSIQNGQLQFIPLQGYLPTEAVVLSAATGMIGVPEQTQDGIKVRCLLNPRIKIGARVNIDNKSVQQAHLNLSMTPEAAQAAGMLPSITDDGFYRVVVAEHEGDTRGGAWYSDLTCIAMNDPVPPALVAKGYT